MADVLYIFPDTNLFIQCKPLDELDWARWKNFAEIHLLVSRPVQAEIDVQKDRGNGRVGKRARTTSALFREVITRENTTGTVAGEAALDFMFWPWAERQFGLYLEPSYDYGFDRGHEQSFSISGGLLFPIP